MRGFMQRDGTAAAVVGYETLPSGRESWVQAAFTDDEQCPTCGAEMDDGECEECERVAPLDFDT